MDANAALQKLCKWRSVFAGWQLGTRSIKDAECQAVRDHREVTMLLRAEVNALTTLLVDKGCFTAAEFTKQVGIEAELLDKAFEKRFPGISTTLVGVEYQAPACIETMKDWKP